MDHGLHASEYLILKPGTLVYTFGAAASPDRRRRLRPCCADVPAPTPIYTPKSYAHASREKSCGHPRARSRPGWSSTRNWRKSENLSQKVSDPRSGLCPSVGRGGADRADCVRDLELRELEVSKQTAWQSVLPLALTSQDETDCGRRRRAPMKQLHGGWWSNFYRRR